MAFFDGLVKGFTNLFGVEPNNLPLVGSAFTNENEKDLVRRMEEAAQAYKNMAPAHAEAQGQALENQMAAYDPTNAMLGAMGGPQAQIDFGQVFQPVFPQGHPAGPKPPTGGA